MNIGLRIFITSSKTVKKAFSYSLDNILSRCLGHSFRSLLINEEKGEKSVSFNEVAHYSLPS